MLQIASIPAEHSALRMVHLLLSGRARWVTHLVGWTMVALFSFSLINGLREPGEAFGRVALNMSFLILLFYGNARVLVNRFLETGRYGLFIALLPAFWLGLAAVRTWAEIRLFGGSFLQNERMQQISPGRMYLAYVLMFFLLLLFSTLYQLLENRHTLELRHRELEVRHTRAQLNYLKAQINPHFLFNTLNNIYAAATLQHPRTADMVLRLSDLLRYVTYDGQAARVPLEKEIAQIRAYLELFQLKSEPPLTIPFEIDDKGPDRLIEPLLLLPLVENALKHGDADVNPQGYVRLSLHNGPQRLLFRVENTFNPSDRQKDEQGGVGLENVRQRLTLNYPGRHRFETRAANNIFAAELEIFN